MNRIYALFFIITLVAFTACKKSGSTLLQLQGDWESTSIVGGNLPQTVDYPKQTSSLKFTDKTFELYYNGKLSASGTYTTGTDKFPGSERMMTYIIFSNSTDFKVFYEFIDKKLKLYYGVVAADGVEITYARK